MSVFPKFEQLYARTKPFTFFSKSPTPASFKIQKSANTIWSAPIAEPKRLLNWLCLSSICLEVRVLGC